MTRRRVLAFICSAAFASPAHAQTPPAAAPGVHVIHYQARVEPDIARQTVKGTVALRLVVSADNQHSIELDRGSLTVDAVRDAGRPQPFTQNDRRLSIQLSRPVRLRETRTIEIDYHGAPRFGLRFFPDRSQAYTVFSTSQWLVSLDAPDERATLDLKVILPAGLTVVASGHLVGRRTMTNGTVVHEWRTDHPVPTYTFGFAAGSFTEVAERRDGITLRYLGDGFAAAELRRIFHETPDMISFFQDRAGVRYKGAAYTQVLVPETVGQEMSGFAVLPESYGRAVLTGDGSVSLGAHELAHQWWGNMVTCRDWTHFWLNEGFATFMAAAYVERRFGRDRYLREIDGIRRRYETVRDAGDDGPLVFPNWNRPTADDRTLVYRKGAYVLHLLREQLGERAFWDGIRHYTRTHFGKSVTTVDFQKAMEQSSGRDLSQFFSEWVYLTKATTAQD
jgi:aminopeptidase N